MSWTLTISGYNHDPEEERDIQRNARALIAKAQETGVVAQGTFSGSFGQADLLEPEPGPAAEEADSDG